MLDTLTSAAALGVWVREELAADRPATRHVIRVITREIDRWFKNGLDDDQIADLAAAPADTGDAHWDALIEGIVARRLHEAGLSSPAWTRRTKLEVGWDPYDDLIRDDGWYALNVLHTPAELLDKGVILSRAELALL